MSDDFAPRKAEQGTVVGYTDADGAQREIRTREGLLRPKTAAEEAVLQSLGFEAADVPVRKPRKSTSRKRRAMKPAESDTSAPEQPIVETTSEG